MHGALRRARQLGARTGFLLCTYPTEEMLATHDVVIAPLVGPEVITGSTRMKAGTATKMVLNTITTGAMVRMGKVYGNLMVDLQVTCQKLQDRGERILMETMRMDRGAATALLERAGGHVKTALVMQGRGVDRDEARRLLDEADGLVGPEVITGSTRMKAGTATKMVLNTITTSSMVLLGKVFGNLMVDLQVTCQKLQDRGERILVETAGLERPAAAALLERAGGHVKTAIVMSKLGVDREEARRRLADADNVLVRVVGDIEI